ncbi:MAG: T9SS type A sorting domain-containing protein, partial [Ignavibacteria bacterium]|nr:T9SS type A sorting domain-containing protein [Ignavibacteria bacterium]
DIYGAPDASFNPKDLNSGLDLTKLSFNTKRFDSSKQYYYRVKYRDHNLKWSGWSNITSFNVTTDIKDNTIPTVYALGQNYPNPFNPITTINYQLPKESFVTISVFDILGNHIAELVNGYQSAGNYKVSFPTNNMKLTSGTYFYQIRAGDFMCVRKMLFLK